MNSIKNLDRLKRLHTFIEQEATGTPKELSRKMNISQRLLFHLIDQLKDCDADIRYDRSRKTYHYLTDFKLHISISVFVISNNETTRIWG